MGYDMHGHALLVAIHASRAYSKATECKPCTTIGKNLKFVIPAKQFNPHIPCVEPNQEIQIDFGGPIFDEKGNEI